MKTFKLKLKDQDNKVTTKTVKADNVDDIALDLIKTRIYKEVKYGKGN